MITIAQTRAPWDHYESAASKGKQPPKHPVPESPAIGVGLILMVLVIVLGRRWYVRRGGRTRCGCGHTHH